MMQCAVTRRRGIPLRLLGSLLLGLLLVEPAGAERLKDVASLAGARTNSLLRYGLVVGLDGTGAQTTQTPFTPQSFRHMLRAFGIAVAASQPLQMKDVAAGGVP